jgi:hypothetical protein
MSHKKVDHEQPELPTPMPDPLPVKTEVIEITSTTRIGVDYENRAVALISRETTMVSLVKTR